MRTSGGVLTLMWGLQRGSHNALKVRRKKSSRVPASVSIEAYFRGYPVPPSTRRARALARGPGLPRPLFRQKTARKLGSDKRGRLVRSSGPGGSGRVRSSTAISMGLAGRVYRKREGRSPAGLLEDLIRFLVVWLA